MEVFSRGVLGLPPSPLLRFKRATRAATAAKGHLRARMILDFLCCRNQRYIRRATDQKCWCRWGVSSSSRDTIKFLLIFEKTNLLCFEICHFPIGIPFKKPLLKNELVITLKGTRREMLWITSGVSHKATTLSQTPSMCHEDRGKLCSPNAACRWSERSCGACRWRSRLLPSPPFPFGLLWRAFKVVPDTLNS